MCRGIPAKQYRVSVLSIESSLEKFDEYARKEDQRNKFQYSR